MVEKNKDKLEEIANLCLLMEQIRKRISVLHMDIIGEGLHEMGIHV